VKNAHIKTELPGPKARALIERDRKVLPPVHMRDYGFVMDHGRGAEVWDVDSNASSTSPRASRSSRPDIAIRKSSQRHQGRGRPVPAHLVRLLARTPDRARRSDDAHRAGRGSPSPSLPTPAPRRWKQRSSSLRDGTKPRFIGFLGGFHGRSMGALSFTSSKYTQQAGFFPTMPGVTHVPFPNNYRPVFAGADQGAAVLGYIEQLFRHNIPADEVAAMLIEPIQGEGGYVVPPDGFLQGLRALCDKHGILLIFDEVQCGIGRTGKMFACEHWGVRPDIITMAKGSPPACRSASWWRASGSRTNGSAARTAIRSAAIRSAVPPRRRRCASSSATCARMRRVSASTS
jgi:4-aminobutyrate aminotransferase